MVPYFNTSGPCVAGQHYMLPPERRLTRVLELVEQGRFFALYGSRQTGKTTSARWLVRSFNAPGGRYDAAWVDLQTAREQPDLGEAMREVLLRSPTSAVLEYLRQLTAAAPRPLVVLFDEADGLVGRTMVSFLTQLRAGYTDRSDLPFPHSVALIGMRQVRDYVLASEDRRTVSWLGTTSPFNITAEAQTLVPFSAAEVVELLGQHTAATGQPFEAAAAARVHALSAGQPWLVNALADQAVRDERDVGVSVTTAYVEAAKETIILERGVQRYVIEVKLRRGTETEQEAEQLVGYLEGLGLDRGWLVLFDLRKGLSWEERIVERELELAGKRVCVLGC
jgi:AAA domain